MKLKTQYVRGAVLGAILACLTVNAANLDSKDQRFVKEAARGGLTEVQMGQLGADKAQSADVKKFGERLVKDHSKANDELKQIASSKGLDLAAQADHSSHDMAGLNGKTGADFDKAYVMYMVRDHRKDIAKFEKEASQGTDSDVKAFANKELPTLREHLRMAEDLAKQLGVDTASLRVDNEAAGGSAGASVSSDNSINVSTDPNDGKTLGIKTEKGDGKTLGLNTDKNDGKILGVFPKTKSDRETHVYTDAAHDKTVTVSTSSDKDASISATAEQPKAKIFSTDKNDGKLWGIFPAPSHKKRANANAGVNVNVDKEDKSVEVSAGAAANGSSAAGSAPSTSSDRSDKDNTAK